MEEIRSSMSCARFSVSESRSCRRPSRADITPSGGTSAGRSASSKGHSAALAAGAGAALCGSPSCGASSSSELRQHALVAPLPRRSTPAVQYCSRRLASPKCDGMWIGDAQWPRRRRISTRSAVESPTHAMVAQFSTTTSDVSVVPAVTPSRPSASSMAQQASMNASSSGRERLSSETLMCSSSAHRSAAWNPPWPSKTE
mmetsp:Transcript_27707/g.93095  ORF Transcript_27707/g.93095 Transcript_27707/m.93095 type:complete len:200 (-) Transcript_27707:321-920(-)